MSAAIVVRDAARGDVDEITSYIAQFNVSAAAKVYDMISLTLELIAVLPGGGTRVQVKNPALQGLHMWPVKRY